MGEGGTAWHFVTVREELSDEIAFLADGPRAGLAVGDPVEVSLRLVRR